MLFDNQKSGRLAPAVTLWEGIVEIAPNTAVSNALEGLRTASAQIEQASQNIAEGAVSAEDVVSLSLAATSFKANAAVIRTENETMQTLLDVTV